MRRNDGEVREDAFFIWPPEPACKGCIHYRALFTSRTADKQKSGLVCHYLLDTGHARGCPFGVDCTKRETRQTSR